LALGEPEKEPVQIMAGELPTERLGDWLLMLPESEKAFGQLIEVGQVLWS
jgi:hypothetical protein